jgi:hypothetical protein
MHGNLAHAFTDQRSFRQCLWVVVLLNLSRETKAGQGNQKEQVHIEWPEFQFYLFI